MSLTSYRAAPPRVGVGYWHGVGSHGRLGGDLLSRGLSRSTIGAGGFHGRVRDGIGCWALRYGHQVVDGNQEEVLKLLGYVLRDSRIRWIGRRLSRDCLFGLVPTRPSVWVDPVWDLPSCEGEMEAIRAISTGKLHALLRFHTRPIDVVVYYGSQARPGFEGGFPLRCLQRLSRPYIATRQCHWRDNRSTRGMSIPVLSY